MTSITAVATTLLSQLYSDKAPRESLTGFTPPSVGFDDSNMGRTSRAACVAAPHSDEQESFVACLLNEETWYHQQLLCLHLSIPQRDTCPQAPLSLGDLGDPTD